MPFKILHGSAGLLYTKVGSVRVFCPFKNLFGPVSTGFQNPSGLFVLSVQIRPFFIQYFGLPNLNLKEKKEINSGLNYVPFTPTKHI